MHVRRIGRRFLEKGNILMWLTIAAILVILWLLGFVAFHVASGLIHILLLIAVIAIIVHFVRGRGPA